MSFQQACAHYDKGVLKIKRAKKAEAKPKQINVNVASAKTVEAEVHGKAAQTSSYAREMGGG